MLSDHCGARATNSNEKAKRNEVEGHGILNLFLIT